LAVFQPYKIDIAHSRKLEGASVFVKLEQPQHDAGTAPTNLINAGVYALSPEILSSIPKGRKVSLEREIFPKLAEKGKLYGYVLNGL
jgi:NDP-sugar pyrophosphorylase family protein